MATLGTSKHSKKRHVWKIQVLINIYFLDFENDNIGKRMSDVKLPSFKAVWKHLTSFPFPDVGQCPRYNEGYILFIFLFVCTYVRLFVLLVRSRFRPVRGITSKFYFKVSQKGYISATTHQKAFKDPTFDLKINVGHYDLYFMVQWLCLIPWRLFHIWTSLFGMMNQYDPLHDLKINIGHCDLYFMVQWFCLYL